MSESNGMNPIHEADVQCAFLDVDDECGIDRMNEFIQREVDFRDSTNLPLLGRLFRRILPDSFAVSAANAHICELGKDLNVLRKGCSKCDGCPYYRD